MGDKENETRYHTHCGSLNKKGPHRLMYLNAESPGMALV